MRASLINNDGSASKKAYFESPDITTAVASVEAGISAVNVIPDQDAATFTDVTFASITEVGNKQCLRRCLAGVAPPPARAS